ncbi:DUF4148 domain-containing protein [Pseudoduganella albidiflava]|uniref:DUF4148 domain-containing protein n=1 Tax=Pseudoduganella albidiflava TaxID=321983 RepID=A0AA88C4W4_9BURK|nr:DUF4148 domain-containing protein [Pseudoduganella albidiflava]GGY58598.1 hypothetical protein GCM10007387_46430 [Pseudoduganella albidiflava]
MKTAYYLIAALALATTGAAIGAENTEAATAAATASTATAAGAAVTQQAPQRHGLTRAEVQAQVIAARKNGTLIESEADMDVAQTRKHYAQ